jgi:hypothetical protein
MRTAVSIPLDHKGNYEGTINPKNNAIFRTVKKKLERT